MANASALKGAERPRIGTAASRQLVSPALPLFVQPVCARLQPAAEGLGACCLSLVTSP